VGRVRHSAGRFDEAEFATFPDVPVFAEHVTRRKDGETLEFGKQELEAIARRCNRRIQETGDYAVLTLGHTPDPDDANGKDPEVVGYAGPYRVGLVGSPGGAHRYAILADFHVFREKAGEVKKHPRRSPELWLADSPADMFLDPIALLGASPPRLDMGMLYSAQHNGRERLKYTAVAPSASSVFVPKEYGCKQEYEKNFDESKHPRDEDGKFGEGGGGGGAEKQSGGGTGKSDSKTSIRVIPAKGIKPAKSPRFHRGSQEGAMTAAIRMSAFHGKPVYMYASKAGIQVSTQKPSQPSGQLVSFDAKLEGGNYEVKRTVHESSQYSKQIVQGDYTVQTPEEIQQLLDALEQLDWVQWVKSQMVATQGTNATPGLEAELPMEEAMPTEALESEAPGEMPPQGPPAGMDTEPLGEEQMPPMGEEETMSPEGEMPQEEIMPETGIAPPEEKTENFPGEEASPDEAKKKLKDAMDAMSDEELEDYVRVRKIGRYAVEGSADDETSGTPPSTGSAEVQTETLGTGTVEEQKQYSKNQEDNIMAAKLGQKGHQLQGMQAQIATLQQELDTERGKRVDAERYALLSERRQHHAFDLDEAVERCRYGKMNDEQFKYKLEDIDTNYRKIPIGEQLPTHGRGIDAATRRATQPAEGVEKYAKQDSEKATKMCLDAASRGEKLSFEAALDSVRESRNGETVKT